MSLLDAAVTSSDSVLVAVDTEAVKDGCIFSCAKMLVLPHLPAVIAGRGVLKTFIAIHTKLAGSLGDFDALAACLPALIGEEISATMREAAALRIPADEAEKMEIVFAGWSEGQQRAVIHHYRQTTAADGLAVNQCVDSMLAPWEAGDSLEGIRADRAGLMEIARRQVAALHANYPDAAGGGKLVIAEVTQKGVRLDHALRFPARPGKFVNADTLMARLTNGLAEVIAEANG